MKILITGGCGFLGSNLASSAIAEGDQVFVIDNLSRQGSSLNKQWLEEQALYDNQFKFSQLDIADSGSVLQFFQDHSPFDAIAHLAGQVAMTTSMENPQRDFLTNAYGTFNLLEATRKYSPESVFIYSSTNKVYGEMQYISYSETETRYTTPDFPHGFNESTPLDFSSPYGCSKGSADQYVRDWHRNFGLHTIIFRHSSIYGGRQFSTYDQGWIGWFCAQALRQKELLKQNRRIDAFTISGTGKQVRDVLHSRDLVDLYRLTFSKGRELSGYIFNIGGGIENSLSLLELFSYLKSILNIDLYYSEIPWRHSDQKVFVADISSCSKALGWVPKISVDQGIIYHLEWLEQLKNL